MKKFLFIIIFLFPFVSSASFPVLKNYNDTIRKNGKIYITLDNDISEVVLKNNISNQALQQEFIDSQKKRINKDRNISIFTSLGIVLFLLALFLVIIVVQFFKSLSNF
jgi:hypothetical protein|tara:strand:- start:41 stop:364 length:324 start_codon:yes stop_codon:yes gene_type:complete